MDKNLLSRFYKDECTEEERAYVFSWLAAIENKEKVTSLLKEVWSETEERSPRGDVDFDQILHNVFLQLDLPLDVPVKTKSRNPYKLFFKIAASISAILVACFFVFSSYFKTEQVFTSYGETKSIILPDGSMVKLNANSKINFYKNFLNGSEREVWLEGEAFFEVAPLGSDQRFVVKTKNLDVEVLGTSFNVKERMGTTNVVLNSGKVKLGLHEFESGEEMLMVPGELVEYNRANSTLVRKTIDPDVYTSWRNNLLVFNDAAFKDIAAIIKESFGYDVIFVDNNIDTLKFTGSNPSDDLDLLLKTLSRSFNLNITQYEKTIQIKNQ